MRRPLAPVVCAIIVFLSLASQTRAQDDVTTDSAADTSAAPALDYRTPRAGEAFTATVFGHQVDVEARDRSKITALDVGVLWIPDGPKHKRLNPFGSFFIWRNWNDGGQRLRAILLGVYDSVRWDAHPRGLGNFEAVVSFENLTPPFDRSEYVEGVRIRSEELRWYQTYAGAGIGYRIPISPGQQDNSLEAALTYEPGYRTPAGTGCGCACGTWLN